VPGRCGCASDHCSCFVVAGNNVSVSGTGSQSNPYVIEAAAIEAEGGGAARLTGEIVAYAGPIAPAGWLLCDGSEVSRTVYDDLFAVVGVAYGGGDGANTFNLPNFVGRFPLGVSGAHPRGEQDGAETVTLVEANLPPHAHTMTHQHTFGAEWQGDTAAGGTRARIVDISNSGTGGTGADITITTETQTGSGSTGNGAGTSTAHDNMPPFSTANFLIKT
jgi:microcystin-dependent protein